MTNKDIFKKAFDIARKPSQLWLFALVSVAIWKVVSLARFEFIYLMIIIVLVMITAQTALIVRIVYALAGESPDFKAVMRKGKSYFSRTVNAMILLTMVPATVIALLSTVWNFMFLLFYVPVVAPIVKQSWELALMLGVVFCLSVYLILIKLSYIVVVLDDKSASESIKHAWNWMNEHRRRFISFLVMITLILLVGTWIANLPFNIVTGFRIPGMQIGSVIVQPSGVGILIRLLVNALSFIGLCPLTVFSNTAWVVFYQAVSNPSAYMQSLMAQPAQPVSFVGVQPSGEDEGN